MAADAPDGQGHNQSHDTQTAPGRASGGHATCGEPLTRHQAIDAFERAYGDRFRRFSVPRAVLRLGARGLRRWRPELASLFGIALVRDLVGERVSPEPLRRLGIEPRPTSERIAQMAQTALAAPDHEAGRGAPAGGWPSSLGP